MVPDPRRYGLPDDYVFVHKEWGSLFYKHYGKQKRFDAKELCSNDGAHLPFPRFYEENKFYRTHFADERIWLDVENDLNEGLKTVDGHFYINYIQSFADKSEYYPSQIPVTDVTIKNYDWVSFADTLHSDSDQFDGDRDGPKAVVMKSVYTVYGNSGEWMLAFEDELVNTVCVYNINPAETCSKCPDEKFCRFAGSEREEIECVCTKTNEGEYCEVDSCSHCQNGGFCEINDETNKVECRCPYPFYGQNCESSSILLLSGASSMVVNSLG